MPILSKRSQKARFVQVLEYMDGPQAVLLERSNDYKVVAVAIEKKGYQYPFFGAAISFDQWERYRSGLQDLRYLFMFPRWKEWYIFDLESSINGEVVVERATMDDIVEREYVPEPGFFAYDHSEPIKAPDIDGLAIQRFNTDGIWDLPDFSEFYNKITDIYLFILSLKKYARDSTPLPTRRLIKESFVGPPLRGGSSYVNLYSGLTQAQSLNDKIHVQKIQYASPGEVEVKGASDIFLEMSKNLEIFSANYHAIKQDYSKIRGYLSKNNLLRTAGQQFDNNGYLAEFILAEGNRFADLLGLEDRALIYELSGPNSLQFVKILLSHFRRMERYFMFYAEGRIKWPEIIADS